MGRHILIAMGFVTAVLAYGCVFWVLTAWASYLRKVYLMHLETKYGYKDSVYLVKKQRRSEVGEPRKHRERAPQREPMQLVGVRILDDPPAAELDEGDPAGWARPEGEDVRQHYPVEWPRGELPTVPEDSTADTMPGHPKPATDPANTMTMTQPIDRGDR